MKAILGGLKRILLGIFLTGFIVFVLLALDNDARAISMSKEEASSIRSRKKYASLIDSNEYYSLLEKYGTNKILAPGYELQCLLALSHYPELLVTPIEFVVRPAFVPLYSWPTPTSVLLPWIERKFIVVISNDSGEFFEPILFHHLSFNEQVGIIGHELAHTLFYQQKNSLSTACIALQYQFSHEFANKIERTADISAIAHGLGYQLFDYANFVRNALGYTSEEIESETGGNYLSPNEILEEMGKYGFY